MATRRHRKRIAAKRHYEERSKMLGIAALWCALLLIPLTLYRVRYHGAVDSLTAMDEAQVARNLAMGEGFVTNIIRPQLHAVMPRFTKLPDLVNSPLRIWLLSHFAETRGGDVDISFDGALIKLSSFFYFATALLLFYAGKKVCGFRTSFYASLIYLFSLPVLQGTTTGTRESLLAFMVTLLFFTLFFNRDRSFILSLLTGALIGLCYLGSYPMLILIVPVTVHILRRDYPQKYRHAAALLGGLACVALPWMVRNACCGGNFITGQPLSTFFLADPGIMVNHDPSLGMKLRLQLTHYYGRVLTKYLSVGFVFYFLSVLFRGEDEGVDRYRMLSFTGLLCAGGIAACTTGGEEGISAFFPLGVLFGTNAFFELFRGMQTGSPRRFQRVRCAYLLIHMIPLVSLLLLDTRTAREGAHRRNQKIRTISDMVGFTHPGDIIMTNAPGWISYYGGAYTLPLPRTENELQQWKTRFAKLNFAALCPYGSSGEWKRMVSEENRVPAWFIGRRAYRYPGGEFFIRAEE